MEDNKYNKRRSFTIEEKLKFVTMLKAGESQNSISQQTGIDRKNLRRWKLQESELIKLSKKREHKRIDGGGRKAFYPEIEQKLLEFFTKERNDNRPVTYNNLRNHILSPDFGTKLPQDFKISDKFLFGWSRRHKITSRKITHYGQLDNRDPHETKKLIEEYLIQLKCATAGMTMDRIFNMDETPCYFDMVRDCTLDFVGSKNVVGVDTGFRKNRYTVCLTISLDGRMLPPMIIFRGLKKIPKVKIPTGKAIIAVNKSGSMDTILLKMWMDTIFCKRGSYFSTTPSLLIWDSYGTHKKEDIIIHLSKKYGSQALVIPPKTTPFMQPLDVTINSSFKAAMRNEWDKWVKEEPPEFTTKGYRKRPSYQKIVDMVISACDKIPSISIQRSFECCGIAANGLEVEIEILNHKLRSILENNKGLETEFSNLAENEENLEEIEEYDDENNSFTNYSDFLDEDKNC